MPAKKNKRKLRRRFGFTLDPDNTRDRAVGEWLNQQPNASEALKALIYMVATGQSGVVVNAPQIEPGEQSGVVYNRDDHRVQALGSLET